MDKNKRTAVFYYLIAAICYVCAVIWFVAGKGGLGALWLCIGSTNLSIGTVRMRRGMKAEKEKKSEEEKTE